MEPSRMKDGVDLSTRLFDDRLRVSTNLSYGDNSTLATQQAFMGNLSWSMISTTG